MAWRSTSVSGGYDRPGSIIDRTMPLLPGTRLGPYEVVRLIGSGGMGQVYLADDPRLHRRVALKLLPQEFAADPDRRTRFEREARAAAAL